MLTTGQLSSYMPTTAPVAYGSVPVMPATAVASPTNQALGVPAGQVGGAGAQARMTMGTNIADVLGILGNTAAKVIEAGAVPTIAPTPPQGTTLAQMAIPPIQIAPKAVTA